MAFSSASTVAPRSVAQINITPLVDVMLVLLVIFMVAVPAVSRPIPLDLAQASAPTTPPVPPERIEIRIDAAGDVYLDNAAIALAALPELLHERAARDPANLPVVQLDPNAQADYGVVAKVLSATNGAGLHRVGFVRQ